MNALNFLRPAGLTLSPTEKPAFDALKEQIDRCTDELLMGPDISANMACVDEINNTMNPAIIEEVVLVLKRKLSARTPSVVLLTLSLLETLVKNCGEKIHMAINNEAFMKEIYKVVKRFYRANSESDEVSELALDIVQQWGEAFLPHSRRYPHIVKIYHDLKKEGVVFKAQYDSSRAPVFTPPSSAPSVADDEALAVAIAASMAEEEAGPRHANRRTSRTSGLPPHPPTRTSSSGHHELLAQIEETCTIMCDIIMNSSSLTELHSNEIADMIISDLMRHKNTLIGVIESGTVENFEALIAANDRAEGVLSTYNAVKKHKLSLDEAKVKLRPPSTSPPSTSTASPAPSSGLDIFDVFNDPSPAPAQPTKPAAPQLGIKIDSYNGEPAKASPSLIRTTPRHGQAVDDEVMGLHAFTSSPAIPAAASSVSSGALPSIAAPPPIIHPQVIAGTRASTTSLLDPFFDSEPQHVSQHPPPPIATAPKLSPPKENKPVSIPILPPPPASTIKSPAALRKTNTTQATATPVDPMDELLSIATRQSYAPQPVHDFFSDSSFGAPAYTSPAHSLPGNGNASVHVQSQQHQHPAAASSVNPFDLF